MWCKSGYVPTEDNLKCLDIDECASKTHDCTSQQMCVNIAGEWFMSVITIFHVCLTKKHQDHGVHVNQDTYQQKITWNVSILMNVPVKLMTVPHNRCVSILLVSGSYLSCFLSVELISAKFVSINLMSVKFFSVKFISVMFISANFINVALTLSCICLS